MVPYGAPAPGGSQQQPYPGAPPQYGAPPQQQQYGAPPQQQYGAPPQQNYGAPPFDPQALAPLQTAPSLITPMAQASPSTLGFGSPQPDFGGFQSPNPAAPAPATDFPTFAAPAPQVQGYGAPPQQAGQYGGMQSYTQPPAGNQFSASQTSATPFGDNGSQFAPPPGEFPFGGGSPAPEQQPAQAPAPTGPALTMSSLQGHDTGLFDGGAPATNGTTNGSQTYSSLADQAYAKFASMDQFDLVSKKDTQRANPFESTTVGAQQPLAALKKTAKVRSFQCCFECKFSLPSFLTN
jgi:hypothetical protein